MNLPDKYTLNAVVKKALKERFEAIGLARGSAKARHDEAAFLSGAAVILQHLFPGEDPARCSPAIPPFWLIAPMTGRSLRVSYSPRRTTKSERYGKGLETT